MLQGQPVWRVSFRDEDLSVEVIQELFSQSAADITAVAVWDNSVRTVVFVSIYIVFCFPYTAHWQFGMFL